LKDINLLKNSPQENIDAEDKSKQQKSLNYSSNDIDDFLSYLDEKYSKTLSYCAINFFLKSTIKIFV